MKVTYLVHVLKMKQKVRNWSTIMKRRNFQLKFDTRRKGGEVGPGEDWQGIAGRTKERDPTS